MRILDQLGAGRSLRAVCRDEGIPSLNTVLKWVRDDHDGFAARYRRARQIGRIPRGRPSLYTAELADRILHEVSESRWLHEICGDPGMPDAITVRLWASEDREGFGVRYRQARENGRFPMGRKTLYSEERARLILLELQRGRALAQVCRDPGMPDENTVRLWVIENREGFAARYARSRAFGDDVIMDEIIQIVGDRRNDWIACPKPNGGIEYILDRQRVRRARLRANARFSLLGKVRTRRHGARGGRVTPFMALTQSE